MARGLDALWPGATRPYPNRANSETKHSIGHRGRPRETDNPRRIDGAHATRSWRSTGGGLTAARHGCSLHASTLAPTMHRAAA